MTWETVILIHPDTHLEFFAFKFLMRLRGVRLTISMIFTTKADSSCENDKETTAIKLIIYGAYILHAAPGPNISSCPPKIAILDILDF